MPRMMPGTTSGSMMKLVSGPLPGMWYRVIALAAKMPRKVAASETRQADLDAVLERLQQRRIVEHLAVPLER